MNLYEVHITKVHSRSVEPRKLHVGVKYYVVHSCLRQSHILRLMVCARIHALLARAKSNDAQPEFLVVNGMPILRLWQYS